MADFSATADALKIFLSGIAGILGVVVGRRSVNLKADPPLEVRGAPDYVTRDEFDKHVKLNDAAHENMYSRLNRNDRETSEMSGTLNAIRDDVTLIKNKLFKTRT